MKSVVSQIAARVHWRTHHLYSYNQQQRKDLSICQSHACIVSSMRIWLKSWNTMDWWVDHRHLRAAVSHWSHSKKLSTHIVLPYPSCRNSLHRLLLSPVRIWIISVRYQPFVDTLSTRWNPWYLWLVLILPDIFQPTWWWQRHVYIFMNRTYFTLTNMSRMKRLCIPPLLLLSMPKQHIQDTIIKYAHHVQRYLSARHSISICKPPHIHRRTGTVYWRPHGERFGCVWIPSSCCATFRINCYPGVNP